MMSFNWRAIYRLVSRFIDYLTKKKAEKMRDEWQSLYGRTDDSKKV